jgi:hypothetical protein
VKISIYIEALKCVNVAIITSHGVGTLTRDKRAFGFFKNFSRFFDDKLINLNGYRFRVAAFQQHPRLNLREGRFVGVDKMFLELVVEKLNATYTIEQYGSKLNSSLNNQMTSGKIDLLLNTRHNGVLQKVQKVLKPVQTFDQHAWCALIPAPKPISYLRFLLTPFDYLLWILLGSSVLLTTIIWQLYKAFHPQKDNVDSVGTFILGIVAFFFLQGISFRNNTPVLTLLLHIFSFILAFLGNAYQSSLISLIHEPMFEPKINSIDEMTAIYHKFTTEIIFNALKIESELHSKIKDMKITSYDEFLSLNFEELAADNTILIYGCDFIEAVFDGRKALKSGQIDDFYYVLPEKLFTSYETLLTGKLSKFNERLNEISLRVFESGIRQHWKVVLDAQYLKANFMRIAEVKERSLLMIKDMVGILKLCGICWLVSLIAFGLEVVWSCLKKSKLGKKLATVCRGKKKRGRKQQAFEMESVIYPYLE